jgi:hypothetical protein
MPSIPTAKNMLRRALMEILDKPPTKREAVPLWEYFGSTCAYCSRPLERGDRSATLDHLVPQARQGSNHLANLVLACGPCNDERRDQPWEEFLRNRCLTRREYDVRRRRILEWVRQYGGKELQTSQSLHEYAQLYIDSALGAVDAVVYVLRDIRDGVD